MDCDTAPLLETGGSRGSEPNRKPSNGSELRESEFVWNSRTCCGNLERKWTKDQGSVVAPSPQ